MFLCKRSLSMLSRFNDVLQSAADVLAPPPTPLQDFQYHWKQVKTFYTPDIHVTPATPAAAAPSAAQKDQPQPAKHLHQAHHKCHLDDTRIPHHLEQMLQLLIREEQPPSPSKTATTAPLAPPQPQPCLEFLLTTRPLDLLIDLGATDAPPGARVCILAWLRRYLSCMRRPHLHHPAVLEPVQRLIALCRGGRASPYETEEILFAACVAGLVRKEPFLVHLFLPAHQHSAYVRRRLDRGGGGAEEDERGAPTTTARSAENVVDEVPVNPPRGNRLFDAASAQRVESGAKRVSIVEQSEDGAIAKEPQQSDDQQQQSADELKRSTETTATATAPAFACDCDPIEDRLTLLDTLLAYTDSPDTLVILRACEGALMLATLPTVAATRCAAVRESLREFAERVAARLAALCERIPEDMDAGDIEDCVVSWGLTPPRDASDPAAGTAAQPHFVGRAQLQQFLGWLDYTHCLAYESCDTMAAELCRQVRSRLLCDCIEPALLETNGAFMLVLLSKIVRQLDARAFTSELAGWLIGEEERAMPADCLLNIIIDNAQDNAELLLPTLQFVEALIDNCNERVLHGMLFRYVNTRGYFDAAAAAELVQTWSDEEDERARADRAVREEEQATEVALSVSATRCRSRTLAPTNILKVINNFLLLLPRQIMSPKAPGICYEEYVDDASRLYQNWVLRTVDFDWPVEATFPNDDDNDDDDDVDANDDSNVPPHPPQSATFAGAAAATTSNDSGICDEASGSANSSSTFDEGPLLRLLFTHVRSMATHPYEFNLAVIAILSKLALFPHPFLHEILLNPEVPVARGTHTLWSSMQTLARQLLLEVPRHGGFQRRVAETSRRLLNNPPMLGESCDEGDLVFEALIILEEFCKELAAIAFVKYHHATE